MPLETINWQRHYIFCIMQAVGLSVCLLTHILCDTISSYSVDSVLHGVEDVLQLESYCVSGSSTTSPLTFEIDYIGCQFSRKLYAKSVQVSAPACTNIPRWTVLTGVLISQSRSPPFSCSGWPCSSTLQNNEIRSKMFCCFWSNTLEFTPIVCSWSVTDTDSVLKYRSYDFYVKMK